MTWWQVRTLQDFMHYGTALMCQVRFYQALRHLLHVLPEKSTRILFCKKGRPPHLYKKREDMLKGVKTNTHTDLLLSAAGTVFNTSAASSVQILMVMWRGVRALSLVCMNHCISS